MAGEGGGGAGGGGGGGSISGLLDDLRSLGLLHDGPRSAILRSRELRKIERRIGNNPLRALPGDVLHATQPGAPQPGGWSARGVDQALHLGLDLAALAQAIRDLFWPPKPPTLGGGGFTLPMFLTPGISSSSGGSSGSIFGELGGLASGIGSIIGAIRGVPSAMPGGSAFLPAGVMSAGGALVRGAGSAIGGGVIAAGAGALVDWLMSPSAVGGLDKPFGAPTGGARARMFVVPNPDTGRPVWFRPAGQPILWSSDLASAKKVRRVARFARRRSGGR